MRQLHLSGVICSAAAALLLLLVPAHAGMQLPKIESVTFTGSHGTYTATISGKHFGAVPSGIPCSDCSPLQLQVVDLSSQPHQESINVTSWTDTDITVTGIAAAKTDQLRIAVYNQTVGNVGTWGGPIKSNKGVPRIKSIIASGSGATLTLTITGSGFGDAPPQVGQNTNSPFFVFTDWNANLPGTDGFPWNAGYCATNDCNAVTVELASWSDTQIVMTGFGDQYGDDWIANPQDAFCVGIWSSASESDGTTGGAYACSRLPK
jgi:hypothetical protein